MRAMRGQGRPFQGLPRPQMPVLAAAALRWSAHYRRRVAPPHSTVWCCYCCDCCCIRPCRCICHCCCLCRPCSTHVTAAAAAAAAAAPLLARQEHCMALARFLAKAARPTTLKVLASLRRPCCCDAPERGCILPACLKGQPPTKPPPGPLRAVPRCCLCAAAATPFACGSAPLHAGPLARPGPKYPARPCTVAATHAAAVAPRPIATLLSNAHSPHLQSTTKVSAFFLAAGPLAPLAIAIVLALHVPAACGGDGSGSGAHGCGVLSGRPVPQPCGSHCQRHSHAASTQ
jgi:hypothetical protein